MNNESAQLVKSTVAASTAGGGIALFYFQSVVACLGIIVGIVLSVVLTVKAVKEMRWNSMLRAAEIEDIKYRQERDLPTRRRSDKVVK